MGLYLFITDVFSVLFFRSGLMTAGLMAWGKTPERRDVLTICNRSGIMHSETFLKHRPVG